MRRVLAGWVWAGLVSSVWHGSVVFLSPCMGLCVWIEKVTPVSPWSEIGPPASLTELDSHLGQVAQLPGTSVHH